MNRHFIGWVVAILGLWPGIVAGQHQEHGAAPPPCADESSLKCAATATPAFAPDGSLWLVWSGAGKVWAARSEDMGRSLFQPVLLHTGKMPIDENGEARPKVAVDGKGRVIVAFTIRQEKAFSGTLMVTRSGDGGAGFPPPRAIAGDPASQRFEAVSFTPDGRMVMAWIDKRGLAAAKRAGESYAGAALALAYSDDAGVTFSPERIVHHHTCECCRLAMDVDGEGRVTLMWRNIYPGSIRDHALMRLEPDGTPGPVSRVAADEWMVEACPHHGPSVTTSETGTIHAAWYTDGAVRQGLFLARSTDQGRTFLAPLPLGSSDNSPSHPFVKAAGKAVWTVWKEFDGERTTIAGMISTDDGATWSPPRVLASTADGSDHPLLLAREGRVYLSWLTRGEGWRLMALEAEP